jgi:hypothetical protein
MSLRNGNNGICFRYMEVSTNCTDVNNNKTRIKWRLGKFWVPPNFMEVLCTRMYTSFLTTKNARNR